MSLQHVRFADRLLAWWDDHGRHDLPWQHSRSPYRVWVSEIMLQQTQVTTVVPYFERWMATFPDLESLATATQDEVLSLWSGLGYYARARNLHRAAQMMIEQHAGTIPPDPAVLSELPGIGESTANAIVSQAFNVPLPILDGNAKRVLARHAGIDGWPGRSQVLKALWAAAEERVPTQRGADYTQSIMDLGATLCRRASPMCSDCPVQTDCRGRMEDRVHELPGRKPRKAVPTQEPFMLLWRDERNRILLERRPSTGVWGGLWCLPEDDGSEKLAKRFGLDPADFDYLPQLEHRLTHRRLLITPVAVLCASAPETRASGVECGQDLAWFRPEQLSSLGLPRPVERIIKMSK